MARTHKNVDMIDLLSSDDEEDNERFRLPTSSLAGRKMTTTTTTTPRQKINETIDLCDSSSDDEEVMQVAAALPAVANKVSRCSSSQLLPSSTTKTSFLYATKPNHTTNLPSSAVVAVNSPTISDITRDVPNGTRSQPASQSFSSHTPMTLPTSKTQASATIAGSATAKLPNVTPSLSSIKDKATLKALHLYESDSDDEIFNFVGLKTTSSTTTRTSPLAKATTSANQAKHLHANSVSSLSSSTCTTMPTIATSATSKEATVVNPYVKSTLRRISLSTTTLTPFPFPKLTERSKKYPDERARFLLAFWKYGKSLVSNSYQRNKLDTTVKRIVRLAVVLMDQPIRSVEELAAARSYIGSVADLTKKRDELRDDLTRGELERFQPTSQREAFRKYHSIVEACLVSLLEHAEGIVGSNHNDLRQAIVDKSVWMALKDLIPAVDVRLLSLCPGRLTRRGDDDHGAAHYVKQSTRSIEFLQIAKLECKVGGDDGPYIKRHSIKGQVYYELLPQGLEAALRIRRRVFPAPPGHYRTSKIQFLEQVDATRYDNICLGVDFREGGGGSKTLHQMCNKLDMMSCPFFVGSFSIGDYVFFANGAGSTEHMNHLCPILVERKSVQDLAMSIADGRWKTQKHRMYTAQYVFGYEDCRMVYIIEGNEDKQTVSGNYVGARRFQVNKEKLQEEISNLEAEGFSVLRTPSMENSMFELARWVQRVSAEVKAGTMKAKFTYAEFKRKVAEIPRETDFSRLARYHASERRAAAKEAAAKTEIFCGTTDSNSRGQGRPNSHEESLSQQSPASKKQKTCEPVENDLYAKWTKSALMAECAAAGLSKSGTRAELVERLKGPRPPPAWLKRAAKKQYVPSNYNVGGTALLVALYLHEIEVGEANAGISKEALYVKAEGLEITKNPFSGGTTQTGMYHYDGWSSMSKLLTGDPALVLLKNRKYRLTRSCDIAGFELARQLHRWCHEWNNCPCGATNP